MFRRLVAIIRPLNIFCSNKILHNVIIRVRFNTNTYILTEETSNTLKQRKVKIKELWKPYIKAEMKEIQQVILGTIPDINIKESTNTAITWSGCELENILLNVWQSAKR
jgi:hypothetical protein